MVSAIGIMLLGTIKSKFFKQSVPVLFLIGVLMSSLFNIYFLNVNISAFGGMVLISNLSIVLNLLVLVSAFLVGLVSIDYVNLEEKYKPEYYALVLFSLVGMGLITKTFNLIVIFISLEIFSLSLYVLVGLCREKRLSLEASLKYFLTGAFISAIFLYGMALIYGSTGTLNINEINFNATHSWTYIVGFIFVLTGFLFKIGVVPFHFWIPDTYQGAPTTITAFMSVSVKIAIFAPLIKIFEQRFLQQCPVSLPQFSPAIWIALVVLTMTVGNIIAISQSNIKRMLAYSSIAHAGYMMLVFLPSNNFATQSLVFYLVSYIFMNIGAFSVVTILERENKLRIEDYSGLSGKSPFLALSMAIAMFSLTGIPPTSGFIAKLNVFGYALKSGYVLPVIIAVINSVVSAYYYLRVIIVMYMSDNAPQEHLNLKLRNMGILTVATIIICIIVIIYLGLFPNHLIELITNLNRQL